jgi:hypothetical protein
MKLTRRRLVGIAAGLSTVALAAPVSTASADARAATVPFPAAAWGGWGAFTGLPYTGPVLWGSSAVVGPVIITTAPSTFINTNNQVSAGGNWSGGQVGP